MKIIVEAVTGLTHEVDTTGASKMKKGSPALSENEKEFRSTVDSIYKISTITLAATTTIAVVFFPPFSVISAGVGLLLALLRFYDKKHDYKLSHAVAELYKKLVGKNGELLSKECAISVSEDNSLKLNTVATTNNKRVLLKIENNKMSSNKHLFFSRKQPSKSSSPACNEKIIEMELLKVPSNSLNLGA